MYDDVTARILAELFGNKKKKAPAGVGSVLPAKKKSALPLFGQPNNYGKQ